MYYEYPEGDRDPDEVRSTLERLCEPEFLEDQTPRTDRLPTVTTTFSSDQEKRVYLSNLLIDTAGWLNHMHLILMCDPEDDGKDDDLEVAIFLIKFYRDGEGDEVLLKIICEFLMKSFITTYLDKSVYAGEEETGSHNSCFKRFYIHILEFDILEDEHELMNQLGEFPDLLVDTPEPERNPYYY